MKSDDIDDLGSVLVEAALGLLLLIGLLFGVVEIASRLRSSTVTQDAVSAGAETMAALYPAAHTPAEQRAAIDAVRRSVEASLRGRASSDTPVKLTVYASSPDGEPRSGSLENCSTDCFSFHWDGTEFILDGGQWLQPEVCGDAPDLIGVSLTMSSVSSTDAVPGESLLSEQTVLRFQPGDCP